LKKGNKSVIFSFKKGRNMISKDSLKEIILENKEYIVSSIKPPVKREVLASMPSTSKVILLHGVRRSGKTYILYDIFKGSSETSLYIDFEDERLSQFEVKDFELLREAFFELNPALLGGENVVFLFDEVHKVEGWERFARRILEKEGIRVYVAGSSTRIHPENIGTSLRGRSMAFGVSPFSFREFLKAKGLSDEIDSLLYGRERILVRRYFEEYLRWGEFPEVAFVEPEIEKKRLLREYMNAMYFRDLVERFEIKNFALFDALWDMLFSSFSRKFSVNSFENSYRNQFPFSKDSLYAYYRHFIESMLVYEVRKYAESPYKRFRTSVKIYIVDNGLVKRVTSQDVGRLLENLVFVELKRKRRDVYYFGGKRECDFCAADEEGSRSVFQVCYELNEESEKREVEGIIEACKMHGLQKGTILTGDREGNLQYEGIEIVIDPVWRWLLRESGFN